MTPSLPTIPEGLNLIPAADGFVIRRVWLTWKVLPLALFAAFWDSFLFFWYSNALSAPHPPLMMVLFPLVHVAVGVGLTYFVLASLLNRTDVTVLPGKVRVHTGPAPWAGNKEVGAQEITALIVRERTGNKGSRTFNVMYVDPARKERKLVSSLAESDQAEFIAQVARQVLRLSA